MDTEVKEYITQDVAAELLGISRVTFWRQVQEGKIEPSAYQAGRIRVPLFDREAILRERDTRDFIKNYKKNHPEI